MQVLGAYQKGHKSYLLNEFCEIGNLQQLRSKLEFSQKMEACIQVAQALSYLHNHANLYHRDIKAENVLICSTQKITIKLCDFGISRKFEPSKEVIASSSPPSSIMKPIHQT